MIDPWPWKGWCGSRLISKTENHFILSYGGGGGGGWSYRWENSLRYSEACQTTFENLSQHSLRANKNWKQLRQRSLRARKERGEDN